MELFDFASKRKVMEQDYDDNGNCSYVKIEKDMTEWEGAEWKSFFEQFCVPSAEMMGNEPWDVFAQFINAVLENVVQEGKE